MVPKGFVFQSKSNFDSTLRKNVRWDIRQLAFFVSPQISGVAHLQSYQQHHSFASPPTIPPQMNSTTKMSKSPGITHLVYKTTEATDKGSKSGEAVYIRICYAEIVMHHIDVRKSCLNDNTLSRDSHNFIEFPFITFSYSEHVFVLKIYVPPPNSNVSLIKIGEKEEHRFIFG